MTNIVITGSNRGIGFALVQFYAATGDRVFAMCRNPSRATALQAVAEASEGRITLHQMDVGDDASVAVGAASTGTGPIDIIFNVAAIVGVLAPEIESMDWDSFDETINVVLKGPVRVFQAFLPRLHAGSKVMNISSEAASSYWPNPPGGGLYAYGCAKAGLNRLMRSISIDIKNRNIIIGLIDPGFVKTDMGGPDADITPEESARGIAKITANWTVERTGDFITWYGRPHPW